MQSTKAVGTALTIDSSAHLDMLRAGAAFLVLISHWRMLLFVDWPQANHRKILLYFFYWITKLGHQAVIVFFVLSGFLVGGSVLRSVGAGNWSAKRYMVHRLTRLEIVLVPALFLCWFWDSLGSHLFRPSPIYLGTAGINVLPYGIRLSTSIPVFLGNLVFLQNLAVPSFGSDDPLWSLTNEFWYYLLFPCCVIVLASSFRWKSKILAGLGALSIAALVGKPILGGFLIWMLGAGLFVLPAPPAWFSHRLRSVAFLSAALFVTLQLGLTYSPYQFEAGYADYVLGALFAIFMYFVLHHCWATGPRYRKFARATAGSSYTLYVTHMPVLVFVEAWIGHRWLPDWKHFFAADLLLGLPLIFAAGVAMLFERNTDRVRKRIEAWAGLSRPVAAAAGELPLRA